LSSDGIEAVRLLLHYQTIRGFCRRNRNTYAEFRSKLDGLLQEADETQLWLELPIVDCDVRDTDLPDMHHQAGELLAIFTTIVSKFRRNL